MTPVKQTAKIGTLNQVKDSHKGSSNRRGKAKYSISVFNNNETSVSKGLDTLISAKKGLVVSSVQGSVPDYGSYKKEPPSSKFKTEQKQSNY